MIKKLLARLTWMTGRERGWGYGDNQRIQRETESALTEERKKAATKRVQDDLKARRQERQERSENEKVDLTEEIEKLNE